MIYNKIRTIFIFWKIKYLFYLFLNFYYLYMEIQTECNLQLRSYSSYFLQ